jgi:arylsulfatase
VLRDQGYATCALGKWHLSPSEENTPAGPYARWPLGRGFERFYGFLGAETHQFYPDLVRDNTFVEPPATPDEGYHLTNDLTDNAIAYLRDLRSVDPSKPFFMYFCTGACHSPHQPAPEFLDRFRGHFDKGWDAWREETFQRQLDKGIVPHGARLSERPQWVRAWDSLSEDERRLFARMMEVFAGFLAHTDEQISRLIDAIDDLGDLSNTLVIVVSDNGASGEGGFFGSFNENIMFNGVPDSLEVNLERIDQLGTADSYGHYPTGWAMAANTPFRRWKRNVHNGGIADPLIVHWPDGFASRGEIRPQFLHAIDVAPTILTAAGVEFPALINGVPQEEVAGRSFNVTFDQPGVPSVRSRQYFEMYGSRALYDNGWKAVTFHAPPGLPADGPGDPNLPFIQDAWELYNLQEDPAETRDLATEAPDRLQEMIALWYVEAGKYDVLPLHAHQQKGQRPRQFAEPEIFRYWPDTTRIASEVSVNVLMRPFSVLAVATVPPEGAQGVLIAQGGQFGGWTLFVQDGRLWFEHNYLGLEQYRVSSNVEIPREAGVHLGVEFQPSGTFEIDASLSAMGIQGMKGVATLMINGEAVGSGNIDRTVPFSFALCGEGLCCGYDSETAVSEQYLPPNRFTGTLHEVLVSPKGQPVKVMAKEIQRAVLIA